MSTIRAKPFNVNQVKIISQSLLRSYKYDDGFPVLKELIQNADDAKSTELRIYYYGGIPNAKHPLLRRKGIFVYDNGEFTSVEDFKNLGKDEKDSNEYGVLSIGGIDKDNDIEKIGKYGLGMKSIFHICDAFFYYINKENRLGAINPFANNDGVDGIHPDWSELDDSDQDLLIKEIKKVIPEPKGFTVLIPDGMPEENQIIENNGKRDIDISYPFNKDDPDNKNFIRNLSIVLALLPKVSNYKDRFNRIIFKNNEIEMETFVEENKKVNSIITKINKQKVSESKFSFFQSDNFTNNEGEEIREYLKQNNAISSDKITSKHSVFYELIKSPKKNEVAKLTIKYCVYLPLQKPENCEIEIESDFDYTLLINGSFLIDEGRQGVESFEFLDISKLTLDSVKSTNVKNPGIAKETWNKLIAQYVVFPNLPNVFEQAISDCLINKEECGKLIKALIKLSLKQKNVLTTFTTSDFGFAEVYIFSEKQNINWKKINLHKDKYIYLPENIPVESLLELLPKINQFEDVYFINGEKKNYLLPEDYNPDTAILKAFIEDLNVSALVKRNNINCLTTFLDYNKDAIKKETEILKVLINKIRELIRNNKTFSEKAALSHLFNTINICCAESCYRIFSIDKKQEIKDLDWEKLWNSECPFLFIPGYFDVDNNIFSEDLLINNENSICSFLDKAELLDETQFIVLDSIGALDKHLNVIAKEFPTLCIYELYDVLTNKSKCINTSRFLEKLNNRQIFSGKTVGNELLRILALLIPREDVFSIEKPNIEKYKIDETLLLKRNKKDILNYLYQLWEKSQNLYVEEEYKSKFVDLIFHSDINEILINDDNKGYYRYILSGFQNTTSLVPLFYITASDVWKKVFEICNNEGYTIPFSGIDAFIKCQLNDSQNILRIQSITNVQCYNSLRDYSKYGSLDFLLTESAFRENAFKTELYGMMDEDDSELFFKLPYQIDSITKEVIRRIDLSCYLNKEDITLPDNCSVGNLKLIAYSSNSKEKHFQETFLKNQIFTKSKAIRTVIENNPEKERYTDWIFTIIREAKISDLEDIWNIPCISVGDSCYTSFDNILDPKLLTDETQDVLSRNLKFYKIDALRIKTEQKELLREKKFYSKNIKELLVALKFQIEKCNDAFYLSVDNIEELKILIELYKSDFSLFKIIESFLKESKIEKGKETILDFYSSLHITSISFETNLKALNIITGRQYQKQFIKFYNAILKRICNDERLRLKEILYPNLEGEWKTADELSIDNNESIEPEYLLRTDTFRILSDRLSKIEADSNVQIEREDNYLTSDSSIHEIKEFFRSWENAAEHKELVAFFLYLLRDNFRKAVATDYSSYSFNRIEKSDEFTYNTRAYELFWSNGYSQKEAFGTSGKQYFKVKIFIPDINKRITVQSISGKQLSVAIYEKNDNSSVIIGEPKYSNYLITMSLLPKSSSDKKDDYFIKKALEKVFNNCYRQWDNNEISRFIQNLINESQNTIKEAEESILDEIFIVLKMYGVKHPLFIKHRKEIDECRRKHSNRSYDRDKETNDNLFNNDKNRISKALIKAVKEDVSLKESIFEAVKKKITDNQYDESSILFEFFQNADDCVNHLAICNRKIDDQNKTFIVNIKETQIVISHFGRLINDTLNSKEHSDEFSQDLYSMITLNTSLKSNETGDTGKFGLGFKSVYTICKEPIVHSGNLDFKIIAGIYPSSEDRIAIENGETRFIINGPFPVSLDTICTRFKQHMFFLSVFSKQIKNIQLHGFYEESVSILNNNIYKNDTHALSIISNDNNDYLLFEDKEIKYQILFRIKDNCIYPMTESNLPKVWNITPLNSVRRLPFMINAGFVVDPGRLTLADQKFNTDLFDRIAKDFANFLNESKEKLSIEISDNIVSDILETFITTRNLQDTTFVFFSESILKTIFEECNCLPNGYGSLISYKEDVQFYSITQSNYVENYSQQEFLSAINTYLKELNVESELITQSVADTYDNYINCKSINLSDLLDFCSDHKLRNENLESFLNIISFIRKNYNIWSEVHIWNFELLNSKNEWVPANTLVLDSESENDNCISDSYSNEVIEFLRTNSIFDINKINRLHALVQELRQPNFSNPGFVSPDNSSFNGNDKPEDENSLSEKEKIDIEFDEYEPDKSIQELYNWWHSKTPEEQKAAAAEYYADLLPDSVKFEDFTSADIELSDAEWFILFILAIYQSKPFCRDLNNKTFLNSLDKLDKEGRLLEKLGENKPSKNPQIWIDVILDFLDGKAYDEVYFTWFNEFPRMIEMSEFKDVYMQVLHDLNKLPEKNKHEILTPESLNEYSGSSLRKAPTIDRAIRIGFSLIIRELIRKNELAAVPKIEKFAFMPKTKCVKFVLGGSANPHSTESVDMYRRIVAEIGEEKARFDGYYDIPLILEVKPGERS